MTAPANIPPPSAPRGRDDGWTPDRRRLFLEAVAAGMCIADACAQVGLSKASVYALRSRDPGFALGWSGASLRSRDAIVDELTERAMRGQVESWIRPDGSEGSRRRYDNRLALALLTRLDKLAEQQDNVWYIGQPAAEAARGVAHDFGGYLDLVEQDEADAATIGRFVDVRIRQLRQLRSSERLDKLEKADDAEASTNVGGQARSSAWTREVDETVSELLDGYEEDESVAEENANEDEAVEEGEASEDKTLVDHLDDRGQVPVERSDDDKQDHVEACDAVGKQRAGSGDCGRAWFHVGDGQWRTTLLPPAGFRGTESGYRGEPNYWRTLTDGELEAAGALHEPITPPLPKSAIPTCVLGTR